MSPLDKKQGGEVPSVPHLAGILRCHSTVLLSLMPNDRLGGVRLSVAKPLAAPVHLC